jgi:hypothetical protein
VVDDRVYVNLGAQAVEKRFKTKDAAVPIDVHRMGAQAPRADDARKPVYTALQVGLVSEIKCAGWRTGSIIQSSDSSIMRR